MKIVYVKTKKILIFSNKVNQILLIKQKIIIEQLQQNKLTIKKIIHKVKINNENFSWRLKDNVDHFYVHIIAENW